MGCHNKGLLPSIRAASSKYSVGLNCLEPPSGLAYIIYFNGKFFSSESMQSLETLWVQHVQTDNLRASKLWLRQIQVCVERYRMVREDIVIPEKWCHPIVTCLGLSWPLFNFVDETKRETATSAEM